MLNYKFNPCSYDIIVMRWCLGYLDKREAHKVLVRAADALIDEGVLIVQDNVVQKERQHNGQ